MDFRFPLLTYNRSNREIAAVGYEIVWHGAKVDEWGTKGGLMPGRLRGSQFYSLLHTKRMGDPDDIAAWRRESRASALLRWRAAKRECREQINEQPAVREDVDVAAR